MPPSRSATQLALILPLKPRLELTDAERDELVRALRRIVHNDQFQLSPRIRRLRQPAQRARRNRPRNRGHRRL